MDEKQMIAEKIKKLLALSESPNIHEAQLAAKKAEELLAKHGMSLTDVEIQTAEMLDSAFKVPYHSPGWTDQFRKTTNAWQASLLMIMQKYFFIHVVLSNNGVVHFLGAKEDVIVAQYVYLYLCNEIFRLADKHVERERQSWHSQSDLKTMRTSFSVGATVGLKMMLEEEHRSKAPVKSASGTDLMVVKGAAVKAFVHDKFPHLSKGKAASYRSHQSSMAAGVEAGKQIQIRKGVSGSQRRIE